jgi:hypothetical protein
MLEGMPMSRSVIVVECKMKPKHRNGFIERSRAKRGCQQFDLLLPQEDQSRVLLVEAWRDQSALDVRSKGFNAGQNPRDLPAAKRRAAPRTRLNWGDDSL